MIMRLTAEYVRSLIREARDGHSHTGRANQCGQEYHQVHWRAGHPRGDLLGDWNKENASDGVADEC